MPYRNPKITGKRESIAQVFCIAPFGFQNSTKIQNVELVSKKFPIDNAHGNTGMLFFLAECDKIIESEVGW